MAPWPCPSPGPDQQCDLQGWDDHCPLSVMAPRFQALWKYYYTCGGRGSDQIILCARLSSARAQKACLPLFLQLGSYGILLGMFWEPLEHSLKSRSLQQHFFVLVLCGAVSCSYTKYKIVKYKEENVLGGHIIIHSEVIVSCWYVNADRAKWKHSGK